MITARDYSRYAALRREGYTPRQATLWVRHLRALDRIPQFARDFNDAMIRFGASLKPVIARFAAAGRAMERAGAAAAREERRRAAAMREFGRRKGRMKWR